MGRETKVKIRAVCYRTFAPYMTKTAVFSLFLCASSALFAQNDDTRQDSARLQEVVITASGAYQAPVSPIFSRLPVRNLDNPQSVQVVTPALLRDRQVQSVGEALSLTAGASLLASAQYGEYVMRGFKMSPGNFAFNGIRGDFFQVDQAALTYNIERIEIMKGPASVLFSAGNPGGVINHVTKTPLADRAMSVQYTFGSFNQHRTVLDATGPLDGRRRLLARFIAGYETTGQYDRNQQISNLFLAPQLEYRFRDSSFVRYEINFSNDDRTMGYQRGVPALFNPITGTWTLDRFPGNTSLIDPAGHADRSTLSNQVTLHHKINSRLALTALYRRLSTETIQLDLSPGAWGVGAVADSIPLENRYWFEKINNHQFSTFLNFRPVNRHRVSVEAVAGLDAAFASRNAEFAGAGSRQTAVLNPSFGWGAYTREAFFEKLPDASFSNGWNEKTRLAGAYAQAHVRAGNHWHFLLGGRGEAHRYSTGYYDLLSGAATYSDSLSAFQWIPRMGALYAPIKNTSFYYSYSGGFQPQWSSYSFSGGPFPPERSRQHEIGVKKEWAAGLSTTLALYHIRKYDVLAPDPADPNGFRIIQIDEVYSRGVELSVQGQLAPGLDAVLNYAYNEARTPGDYGYDGNPAGWFPGAPNTSINAWTHYTPGTGLLRQFRVGLGAAYLSKRSTYTPGFEIPAFTTIDAVVAWESARLRLALNLYNLMNTRYWHGAYGPSNLWPGNPRTFRITASCRIW